MRDIHVSSIADAVKKLCMEANWNLEPDMLRAFDRALTTALSACTSVARARVTSTNVASPTR